MVHRVSENGSVKLQFRVGFHAMSIIAVEGCDVGPMVELATELAGVSSHAVVDNPSLEVLSVDSVIQ